MSHKHILRPIALAVLGLGTNAHAEDLIDLIPGLYGGDGLTMEKEVTVDDRTFDQSQDFLVEPCSDADVICALNDEISSEIELAPVSPSTRVGFTYRFDLDTGTYVRTPQKLGLLIAERPQTMGRGNLSIRLAYTFFEYDSFEGDDLDNLTVRFNHTDIPNRDLPDENDWIDVALDVSLEVQAFMLAATFGLTDRLDITAIVPYVDVDMDVKAFATYNDWDGDVNPDDASDYAETRADSASGDASGLGDIVLAGKYYWVDKEHYDIAAGLRVKFNTGNEDNFLGTGDTRIRPVVIATRELSETLTAHINAGFEFNTDDSDKNRWVYRLGLDSGDSKFSVAVDLLGRHDVDGDGVGDHKFDAGVGVKWAPVDDFILGTNLLFPLNSDEGLRSHVITTLSLEYRN